MKRIIIGAMSTLSALILLFSYQTSTGAAVTPVATAASQPSAGSSRNDDELTDPEDSSDPSGASTVYTGAAAQTRYGAIQVEVTVRNGTVVGVAVPTYPASDHKDVEINTYALPILIQETLDQQGADIDMVSGATVTSQGYIGSLQDALDQAGL